LDKGKKKTAATRPGRRSAALPSPRGPLGPSANKGSPVLPATKLYAGPGDLQGLLEFKVPKEHVKQVLKLWDRYEVRRQQGQGRVSNYELWEYIYNIIPEIDEDKNWEIRSPSPCTVKIVETMTVNN